MTKLNLVCLIFVLFIQHSRSKHSAGIISTPDDFAYLERFCFVSEVGALRYSFAYPQRMATQSIFLYYDSPEQWPAIYGTGKTCQEKAAVLKEENYQIMRLDTYVADHLSANCRASVRGSEPWITCDGSRRFSSYRERWWYVAVANCEPRNDSEPGLYLEYELTMTNGPQDSLWFHHFSADEFYILQVDIAFLFLEVLTLVAAISVAVILRARQMLHTTYKLFMGSLVMEVLGLFADTMSYGRYARDGEGAPSVKFMGQMLRGASRVTFLLMLILMGKGFTITRGRLSTSGTWKIGIFTTIYSVIYGALFIYEARAFDPARVLYLYESPAGYGILIMGLIGWAWFCRAIYCTLVHYPEKRGFYLRFCVFFSIWFWMAPVMVMLSNHILPNWMREKIVNGLENAISFLGFAAFMVITRPSAANRNFPYHVRTSQIDALNAAYDNTSQSVSLPHHTYEMRMAKLDEVFTVTGKAVEKELNEIAKGRRGKHIALDTEDDEDEGNLQLPPPPYDDCVGEPPKLSV